MTFAPNRVQPGTPGCAVREAVLSSYGEWTASRGVPREAFALDPGQIWLNLPSDLELRGPPSHTGDAVGPAGSPRVGECAQGHSARSAFTIRGIPTPPAQTLLSSATMGPAMRTSSPE